MGGDPLVHKRYKNTNVEAENRESELIRSRTDNSTRGKASGTLGGELEQGVKVSGIKRESVLFVPTLARLYLKISKKGASLKRKRSK